MTECKTEIVCLVISGLEQIFVWFLAEFDFGEELERSGSFCYQLFSLFSCWQQDLNAVLPNCGDLIRSG